MYFRKRVNIKKKKFNCFPPTYVFKLKYVIKEKSIILQNSVLCENLNKCIYFSSMGFYIYFFN